MLSAAARPCALPLLLVLTLWGVLHGASLFSPPLLDDADSVHAEASREILLRNDWVTLHADGIRYLEKAPLMYWGMAGVFRFLGVSEWTARLPLAAAFLALLWTVYALGGSVYGGRGGYYSSLVLATAVGPYLFTRFLIPDLILGLWLAVAAALFLRTLEQASPSRPLCWGLAAATGLAVLTKGYIGLLFPGAVIVVFLAVTRNLGHLRRLRLPEAALVFLAVAAPWHVLAALRTPFAGYGEGVPLSFTWFYFYNDQVLRFLGQRVPHDYDKVPLLLFWGLCLVWLFPWSSFLFQALGQVPASRSLRSSDLDRRDRLNLLCAIWALVILVFFSFSTRQEYYAVPALPALSLLIGGWLAQETASPVGSRIRSSGRLASKILLAVGVVAFACALALTWNARSVRGDRDLSTLLAPDPSRYALSMGHFFDLTPQSLGAFRAPLLVTGFALLAGALLNDWARRRNRPEYGNFSLALMMVVVLLCVHAALVRFAPVLSSKELAEAIQREYQPGEIIEINGEYEDGSTLNFYTGVPVRILNGRSSNLWYGSLFPDAPKIFDDDASFQALWKSARRVYLFTAEKKCPKAAQNGYVVAASGGKIILSNRPGGAVAGTGSSLP